MGGISADSAARLVVGVYANSVGDKLTVTLQGDGAGNPNGIPQPFGSLRCRRPRDCNCLGSQLTVTAVATGGAPMAFLLYIPPRDFSRGPGDDSAQSRAVSITAVSHATGINSTANVTIWRPPVVLVHGFWDKFPMIRSNFAFDPNAPPGGSRSGLFWTARANHKSLTRLVRYPAASPRTITPAS